MYSIAAYGSMTADRPRMQAYEAALRRVVRHESVVLDLGCGSGIMAFLACRLGARKVIAIEPDNVLQLARQIATANGWDDRIEFLHGFSTAMTPPGRCDVVVSDIGGALPLFMRHIPTIVDVRERWLIEGGTQLPQQDSIYAAVIESRRVWDAHLAGWTSDMGVDFSPAMQMLSGCIEKVALGAETLLTEPAHWVSLDYRTVVSPNHEARLSWQARRAGTGHGFALWFDRVLTDDVMLSNRPGAPLTIAGQMFFPFPEPVALQAGDRVDAHIRAHLVGDQYVWAWNTDVHAAESTSAPRTFRQSTLQGALCTDEWLNARRLDARLALGAKGRAALEALEAMETGTAVHEISTALTERFPSEFPNLTRSLGFVSDLQRTYGAAD